RTPATRATFDLILTLVASNLGDVPHDVVRSAADAVLECLKDDDMQELDMRKELDDILGVALSSKQFNELVDLGRKITDYDVQDDEDVDMGEAEADAEIDERQGVAVTFDDEEDDDAIVNEVHDQSSEDEATDEDESEGADGVDVDGAA